MSEEEFKRYVEENIKSISSKIEVNEIEFIGALVMTFDKICEKNEQLKEVIEEIREELKHIDKDIMETCKTYDVNGIKIKQILDKVKDSDIK